MAQITNTSHAALDVGHLAEHDTIVELHNRADTRVVDVTDATYGAVGDGITDDTAAIQAAINAAATGTGLGDGGVVFFPPGQYLVTDTLEYYHSITLQGSGRNATVIRTAHSVTALTSGTPGTRIFNVFVNDLGFVKSSGTPAIVVDWHDVTYGGMNRVEINGYSTSTTLLRIFASTSGYTIWNNFYDVQAYVGITALLLTGPSINQNRFWGCRFSGNASGGNGIEIENGNNNAFYNCTVEGGETGVKLTAATNGWRNVFHATRFEGNTNGIVISGSACRGNVFKDTYEATVTTMWSDTSGWANTLEQPFSSDSSECAVRINGSYEVLYGSGTPEGAVTAPVSSSYYRTDGGTGTTLYVKESGTGNTGWAAK